MFKVLKEKKKILIDIFISVFIFIYINNYMNIRYNNIIYLFIIFMCFIFSFKIRHEKKYLKDILIISSLFSIFYLLGDLAISVFNTQQNIFKLFLSFNNIIKLISLFCLFYKTISFIYPKLTKLNVVDKKRSGIKKYLIIFFSLFIMWLPYYLYLFPGIITGDTLFEMGHMSFNSLSDAHPFFHTLFMSIFFKLGLFLFHNATIAFGFVELIQFLIMTSIISYAIYYLINKGVKRRYIIVLTLFYAIAPIFGIYVMCMWKDILFSGFMVLFVILFLDFQEKKIEKKDYIKFGIVSLLVLFFRNNAIYMYILLIPFIFIYYKKVDKVLIPIMILMISIYFVVKGPIFKKLNIEKSPIVESLGVPLQQVSRAIYKNIEINDEDKELINEILSIEEIKSNYVAGYADSIKFHNKFNMKKFNNSLSRLAKLYIDIGLKRPDIYIEESLFLTLTYFYPNRAIEELGPYVKENQLNVESKSLLSLKIAKIYSFITKDDVPVLTILWKAGLYTWVLIISFFTAIRKKKKLFPYYFLMCYIFTLLIGAPTSCLRYYFPVICITPILIFYPYFKPQETD